MNKHISILIVASCLHFNFATSIGQECNYIRSTRDVSFKQISNKLEFIPTEAGKYTQIIYVDSCHMIDKCHYLLFCKAYSSTPWIGTTNDSSFILKNSIVFWYKYDLKRKKLYLHKSIKTDNNGKFTITISKNNNDYYILMATDKEGVSEHYLWQ